MNKENLLDIFSRLAKFQKTGENQYKCCCPAHNDKNPSLSVKFIEDRVLLHDFAGCNKEAVISRAGVCRVKTKFFFYALYGEKGFKPAQPCTDFLKIEISKKVFLCADLCRVKTKFFFYALYGKKGFKPAQPCTDFLKIEISKKKSWVKSNSF